MHRANVAPAIFPADFYRSESRLIVGVRGVSLKWSCSDVSNPLPAATAVALERARSTIGLDISVCKLINEFIYG